jgi:AbrB family looped-hinge helix DNA binding protein
MKAVVTLSSKNQIAIPKAARKKLAIGPGDQLILDVEKDSLILKPKPKSYTKHLRGLHKAVWEGLDATEYGSSSLFSSYRNYLQRFGKGNK